MPILPCSMPTDGPPHDTVHGKPNGGAPRHARLPVVLVALAGLLTSAPRGSDVELPLDLIHLPAGFSIGVYTAVVPGARSLTAGPPGVVFVGTRDKGVVYAIEDRDADGRAEKVLTIARGLDSPNGVAYSADSLYVAEIDRILRFDGIGEALVSGTRPGRPVVVSEGFPRDRHHGWKFIAFGPDGLLYVPVGAPCNVCESDDPRHATIMRMKPDGTGLEVFARGVRNTVGFDWDPASGEIWFTDNGRDLMGDDLPPDELNHASRPGMHFGFPYCHGGDIADPKFGERRKCSDFAPPVIRLGAHVAALGMRFYDGSMFPPAYSGRIFVAEHGSWNRSSKSGYRVGLVRPDSGGGAVYEPFAEGWLQGERAWGRPVDVLVMPDGALLVSDDRAGAVYRISYAMPEALTGEVPDPPSPPARMPPSP